MFERFVEFFELSNEEKRNLNYNKSLTMLRLQMISVIFAEKV